jgi:hypothetical protein
MVIDMDETRLQTISQLSAFLAGTLEVQFSVPDSDDRRYATVGSKQAQWQQAIGQILGFWFGRWE